MTKLYRKASLHRAHFVQVAALLLCAAMIVGCGKTSGTDSTQLKVVATTGMIADAVKVISGGRVDVTGLMGPGVDPHLYKATKGDIDALDGAELILYNGLNLEAKMVVVFQKMSRVKRTVAVAEAIDESLLRHPAYFQGHPDPHVWFDVSMWREVAKEVGKALIEMDSTNQKFYAENLSGYLFLLDNLHAWVDKHMQTIPKEKRVLVTAHDAFGYFGRAYKTEVAGLQGISTVLEAGLYDVTLMVDMLVERKIKAVFVESSVPRKAIEAVVEGCRDRGHDVVIGGELFSDAMGEEGTPEGTYAGMVRHNVNTIVNALR